MNARGILSDKQKVAQKVMQIAKSCRNLDELVQRLKSYSIQTYDRKGTFTGVMLGNKKYRLTTLGVTKEHLKQLTIEQQRLEGLVVLKGRDKTRGLER